MAWAGQRSSSEGEPDAWLWSEVHYFDALKEHAVDVSCLDKYACMVPMQLLRVIPVANTKVGAN